MVLTILKESRLYFCFTWYYCRALNHKKEVSCSKRLSYVPSKPRLTTLLCPGEQLLTRVAPLTAASGTEQRTDAHKWLRTWGLEPRTWTFNSVNILKYNANQKASWPWLWCFIKRLWVLFCSESNGSVSYWVSPCRLHGFQVSLTLDLALSISP